VADGRFASRWSLFGAFLRCHSWIVNMTDVWHLIHLELPVAAPRTGLDAVSVLMNAQKALAPQEAQH
jgi:hypothetical protein